MDDDDRIATDDAYRAVGRYVVSFSQLIPYMRLTMADRLMQPGDGIGLSELAFGESTAGQICNSFFAMCREVGNFDDDETTVARLLQNRVNAEITRRNDITHGDWWVGGTVPVPTLVRVKPARATAPRRLNHWTPADLDAASETVAQLAQTVTEFGQIAMRLHMRRPHGRRVQVRDVYCLDKKKKTVLRAGPKASTISYSG